MSAARKRTDEEILAGLTCTIAEAARIMRDRTSAVDLLIRERRLRRVSEPQAKVVLGDPGGGAKLAGPLLVVGGGLVDRRRAG